MLNKTTSSISNIIIIISILSIILAIMIILAILDAGKYAKKNYYLLIELVQQKKLINNEIKTQNDNIIQELKELNKQIVIMNDKQHYS